MTPYGVTNAVTERTDVGSAPRSDQTSPAHTMAPAAKDLPDVLPTDRLNERGMATPAWRDELRKIPNVRNGFTVVGALAQSFGVVIAAAWINTWWSYLIAFVLMTRGHVCLNILAHEAAHRLLFTNRRLNDNVGRWLLAYPTYQAMLVYRRVHFAHHRDEMGPDEPDLALYAGYPIPKDSWHRKLKRDAIGNSASKNFKSLGRAIRSGQTRGARDPRRPGRDARRVARVHATAGVRGLDPVVVDVVEGVEPAAVDRRTRRHDPLEGPTPHHARHPSEPARPLLDGPVQHRLASRPSRRHGGAVAQPAATARRTRAVRLGHRGHHLPELSRVLAGRDALIVRGGAFRGAPDTVTRPISPC